VSISKEQLRQRIERFTSFLDEQENLTYQKVDTNERGKHLYTVSSYIISSGAELAMVGFNFGGGVQLTAVASKLKELILRWIAQESCPYISISNAKEKLDPYRYLLEQKDTAHDRSTFPPSGALQLMPQDNPLVELAELMGHVVYLLAPANGTSPRYGIATQQEMVAHGDNLPSLLARYITGQPTDDTPGLSQTSSPRKIYLGKNVKHPLAYWRMHTKMPGSSWFTQRMLASLAGLSISTVKRIEQVRQELDQTYVYLATAKSIIAALNEVREQQGMPLLQLWNIDWAPMELDEEYEYNIP
jgi:hypothetical protein